VPRARLTWVGHSTVLIDLDGVRLLTDPVLRARVGHLRRATGSSPETPRGLDAVLVSHAHWDHLDTPSLERLGRSVPVVLPRGAGRLLRRRRFEHVVEVGVGEQVEIGGLSVLATYAEHSADRGPLGVRAPSLGFLVSGSQRIYFAGDTDLFDGMAELAAGLDVALLPIWGWGSQVTAGHLDPLRAAEALGLLRPRFAVPIHWGTYSARGLRKAPPPSPEPARAFERHAAELAPGVEVRVLLLGGTTEL
jgi:L-ascorbate metabolism protein UlaG (beta-lactamase superfamily)